MIYVYVCMIYAYVHICIYIYIQYFWVYCIPTHHNFKGSSSTTQWAPLDFPKQTNPKFH